MHPAGNQIILNEWLLFVKTGDLNRFAKIYEYYFDRLFNYGKKYRIEIHIIEDAIQNLFVRLNNSRKELSQIKSLDAYIFSSFRNELFHLNTIQKRFCLIESIPGFLLKSDGNFEESLIREETDLNIQVTLARIIKKLSPSQQETIYLRFYSDMSYEEISKVTGISVESCRTSVYRSLKILRDHICLLREKGVIFYL